MKTVYIYALIDPRNEQVRYVGKSKFPKKRLNGHLQGARKGFKTHRHNWIRQLLNEGLKPDLLILEEVKENEWEQAEKKWIVYYRDENGKDLTNTAEGGQAPPPYQHTEESRKRVGELFRGKPISDEHKQKISEGKKRAPHPYRGKKLSVEHKKKIAEGQKGRKHSEETKRKISETHKGENNPNYKREFSPEYRQKLSEGQKGRKHSEETKQKMREARKKFYDDHANRLKTSKAMMGNKNRKNRAK
jgi:hypothetical protein